MRKVVQSEGAPKPAAPYSQGIVTDNFVFTAGQVAFDPATGKLIDGGIKEQTRQVMENLKAVLEAAGTDFPRVVKATVFLADINDQTCGLPQVLKDPRKFIEQIIFMEPGNEQVPYISRQNAVFGHPAVSHYQL